ncbi:MAG TPA: diguanylate cyclase [Actinomycetota bacterium]|nr:diguanylate cyclase [Actinomycetota bacterium]
MGGDAVARVPHCGTHEDLARCWKPASPQSANRSRGTCAPAPGAGTESLPNDLARLKAIVELAPIGIGIVDRHRRTVMSNQALRVMLGYAEEEFAAMSFDDYTHPQDSAANDLLFEELMSGGRDSFEMEKRFFHKVGGIIWGRLTVSLLRDGDDRPDYAIGMLENITEKKRLEEELRQAEARYRVMVERVPAVVYVAGIGPLAPWTYVSPQIESMLGFTPEEWLADAGRWLERVHPDDRDAALGHGGFIATDTGANLSTCYRMIAADGRTVWVRDEATLVRDENGAPAYFAGVLVDLSHQKAMEEELERRALHDPLTGLANRNLLHDRTDHALKRLARHGRAALVFIDLDDFKLVNDTLGHSAGDELLVGVGKKLAELTRAGDTAARLGGDEFAVLLEDLDNPSEAVIVADRLCQSLSRCSAIEGLCSPVTASIGVAISDQSGCAEELLRNADLAMYEAKRSGKARVVVFDPASARRSVFFSS